MRWLAAWCSRAGRRNDKQAKRRLVVVALLGMALSVAASGCGSTSSDNISVPTLTSSGNNAVPAPSPSATTPTPTPTPPRLVIHGNGQKALGTIDVPNDTTLTWSCANCSSTNFQINNARSDDNQIPTNALDQRHGADPLPAGTYHTVVVNTTGGPWTITIDGATQSDVPHAAQQSPGPASGGGSTGHKRVFHGDGQKSLGTIVVPNDTTIAWSCPSCSNTNFQINNAQSDANQIPTNGLDQTHGVDPLPAGTYHTVVVNTTGGPWTVTIGG